MRSEGAKIRDQAREDLKAAPGRGRIPGQPMQTPGNCPELADVSVPSHLSLHTSMYRLVFEKGGMTQNQGPGASIYCFQPLPCLWRSSYEVWDKSHHTL